MNKKLTLSANEIDNCSESIYTELTEKYGCQSKEAKRICLTAEEILLSVREKFGDDHSVEMVLKKHIGRSVYRYASGVSLLTPDMTAVK